MAKDDDRLAVSVAEATRLAGISRSKLYELMSAGEVEFVNVGSRRLVLVASLRAFFDRLKNAA